MSEAYLEVIYPSEGGERAIHEKSPAATMMISVDT
jgi:hypothetical protein